VHQSAETFDGQLGEAEAPSLLDRPLNLALLSWLSVGWVAVAIVAFLIRVVNYSSLPLTFNEASLASNALNIVQGGSIPASASSAPLPTALTALALFLFGSSDGIVRLIPLLAGLGTLGLIWWLRLWIGNGPALAAAALVSISPTFVQASRNASDGGLLIFSTLLTLIAGLAWLESRSGGYALLSGVGVAMMVMADPSGWFAVPMIVLAIAMITVQHNASLRDIPVMLLGAAATIVLVSTNLFTHPTGFSDFFRESLRALWNQHMQNVGAEWHLAFFQITIDETLALGLAVLAVVFVFRARSTDQFTMTPMPGLLLWTVLGLAVGSILGGKNVTLYTLTAVPLLLLAGVGLDALVNHVYWPDAISSRGLLFVVAIPITFFAGVSTYGLLSSDIGTDAFAWIFTFVLVAVVIFAPLLALTIWIGKTMPVQAWALVALFVAVLLAGTGIRTSALLQSQLMDRPGEPLTVGDSTPAVGLAVKQIIAVSRDMTTFAQDARDPTGGHGLTIAVDTTISQPFAWYFRDFPNLQLVSPNEQYPAVNEPQVVIAAQDHGTILASTTDRLERTMQLSTNQSQTLSNPNWSNLFHSLIHPGQWARFPEFLLDRHVQQPSSPTNFRLSLRQDVVKQMYGATPPPGN